MPTIRAIFAILVACVAATSFAANAALTIRPAQPAEGSLVTIEGMTGCMNDPFFFSLDITSPRPAPATIKIFDPGYFPVPLADCPPAKTNRLVVGPLPAGEYRVELYLRTTPQATPFLQQTTQFSVRSRANAMFPPDWLGLWADPANPGWGLSIMRDPSSGNVFSAWYVNESVGPGIFRPVWLVAPNMSIDITSVPSPFNIINRTLKGDLYRATSNRAFFDGSSAPFSLSQVDAAGTIELTFSSSTSATMTWNLTGTNLFAPQLDGGPLSRRSGTTRLEKLVY